jgi:hypothetical protein
MRVTSADQDIPLEVFVIFVRLQVVQRSRTDRERPDSPMSGRNTLLAANTQGSTFVNDKKYMASISTTYLTMPS